MKKKEDIFIIDNKNKNSKPNHILSIFNSKNPPKFDKFIIYLYYSYQKQYYKFNLPARIMQNDTRIILNDIIEGLKTFPNIKLQNHSLSYFIPENNNNNNNNNNSNNNNNNNNNNIENYFYLGKYPFYSENKNLLIENPENKIIFIKLRPIIDKTHLLRFEIFEDENEINKTENEEMKTNYYINENSKRAKERKINEIVLKVYEWKKIYNNCINKNGEKVKLTLQDAAALINLSKKSLDEYLNQIKYGKKFGFDFNKHKKSKVGILRGFVKKMLIETNKLNHNENGKTKVIKILKDKKSNDKENNDEMNYDLKIISKDKDFVAKKIKRNLTKK